MWLLAGLLFVGVGVFNAVATWLDVILADLGRPGVGGALIAFMTVAGIGVVFVLAVQGLLGNPHLALAAMSALALPGVFLAARLPEVRRHAPLPA